MSRPVITRQITLDDITPEELATVFAGMWAEEQAAFFAKVWQIARNWPGAGWCHQCSAIAPLLDQDGKDCIAKLAEWAADPMGEAA